ncbi:MAG: hypothetical protein KW806_00060 [Candidatus Yanofskybacteria bacterium]|nr:hypothetical protein [Candidatus Yanofskybacteria bacterium]
MQGERISYFSQVVISVARLLAFIRQNEIRFTLRKTLERFIVLSLQSPEDNVAQYVNTKEILSTVRELLLVVEQLRFFKLTPPTSVLLAQKSLLTMQVFQTNSIGKLKIEKTVKVAAEPVETSKEQLGGTKEKIFTYIKKFPRVRSRDVIDEFSVFSERTVKRSLKELARNGFIERFIENKAVYYSVSRS